MSKTILENVFFYILSSLVMKSALVSKKIMAFLEDENFFLLKYSSSYWGQKDREFYAGFKIVYKP
jgi:hypothetical protein